MADERIAAQAAYNQCKAARPSRSCKTEYYNLKSHVNLAKATEATTGQALKDATAARKAAEKKLGKGGDAAAAAHQEALEAEHQAAIAHGSAKGERKAAEATVAQHSTLGKLKALGGSALSNIKAGASYVAGGAKSLAQHAVSAAKVVGGGLQKAGKQAISGVKTAAKGIQHAGSVAKAAVSGGVKAGQIKHQALAATSKPAKVTGHSASPAASHGTSHTASPATSHAAKPAKQAKAAKPAKAAPPAKKPKAASPAASHSASHSSH